MLQQVDGFDDRVGADGRDDLVALHEEESCEITSLDGLHRDGDDLPRACC